MKRVKLVVAYDGTAYHGWQVQPNGRTIEGELNRALSELLQEEIQVIGASRTDSGVHALCNVAVFDTQARIPAEKICYAVNQRLPEDIRCGNPVRWHLIFILDTAAAGRPMSTGSIRIPFQSRSEGCIPTLPMSHLILTG